MKFTIEIDTECDPPCVIGEALRGIFFDQHSGEYGGYTTFEYNAGIEKLPDEDSFYRTGWNNEEKVDFTWCRAQWNGIICRYYWDGDGTLEFIFPDRRTLENTDCKKDYKWKWKD